MGAESARWSLGKTREEGGGGEGMGSSPVEDVGVEEGEHADEGNDGDYGGEVANMLDTVGEGGVGGEGEDEGSSRGDDKERKEPRRGRLARVMTDKDGEGEGSANGGEAIRELVGEIEEGDEVTEMNRARH